jgi:hypothetical protein
VPRPCLHAPGERSLAAGKDIRLLGALNKLAGTFVAPLPAMAGTMPGSTSRKWKSRDKHCERVGCCQHLTALKVLSGF